MIYHILKDWVYKKNSSIYNYLFPGFRLHLDTLDILGIPDTLDTLGILEMLDIVDTLFLLIQQDWTLFGSYHTRLKPCQCLPRRFSKISAICVQIMYLLQFLMQCCFSPWPVCNSEQLRCNSSFVTELRSCCQKDYTPSEKELFWREIRRGLEKRKLFH